MANEKRLIDANALHIPKYESSTDEFIDGYRQGKIDALIEVKALAPTVNAVEVVRCKDCKRCTVQHNHITLLCQLFCTHRKGYPEVSADDFCSYGERKDDHE